MGFFRTTIYSSVSSLIKIFASFLTGKIIALSTGPSGLAVIGQFNNFVYIVFNLANGAINSGVVKYTAENQFDSKFLGKLYSTATRISIYSSVALGLILVGFSSTISILLLHSNIYINPIRILGLSLVLYSLNSLLLSILTGLSKIRIYTIINTVGSILGLILTIVLVFLYHITGALYAVVLSQTLVFFVASFLIIKNNILSFDFFLQSFNFDLARKLSHYSLMAIVSSLSIPITLILIRNLMTERIGVNAAGNWQGLMRVSEGYLAVITAVFATYYLPKLSTLSSNGELRLEVFKMMKIVFPVVLTMTTVIYFSRYFLIELLYSSEFNKMEELFLFYLIGDVFKIMSWTLSYILLAKSMTKEYIFCEIGYSLFYIFLAHGLIDSLGEIGVVLSYLLSSLLYLLSMLFIFRHLLIRETC